MAKHTMQEAAELVGVGRSTIWRLVKTGKMSATKNDKDVQVIDSAELHRLFPKQRAETTTETIGNVELKHEETELKLLKQEVEYLKQIITGKDETIAVQAQALRLLEHKPEPVKAHWWNRKLW